MSGLLGSDGGATQGAQNRLAAFLLLTGYRRTQCLAAALAHSKL